MDSLAPGGTLHPVEQVKMDASASHDLQLPVQRQTRGKARYRRERHHDRQKRSPGLGPGLSIHRFTR